MTEHEPWAWGTPLPPPPTTSGVVLPPPPRLTPPAAPGPPSRPRRSRAALAALLAGLVLVASGVGIGWDLNRGGPGVVIGRPAPELGRSDGRLNASAIASRVTPAVVDVTMYVNVDPPPGTDPFGGGGRQVAAAAGTGMVLTPSGQVLTNNHVVEGATSVKVTIQGRGTFPATVIGVAPSADVALLQIQGASGLPTVSPGGAGGLRVGQAVVAIGNALGRGGYPKVTQGAVSALGQSITASDHGANPEHLTGMIQTDASISPGDSGGPLVDANGRVVGMITASAADRNATSSNIGYAITIDSALRIVSRIREGRSSAGIIIGKSGLLGVQVEAVTGAVERRLGLPSAAGALVIGVIPGTPAAGAGIPQSAVIVAVNGTSVATASALGVAIRVHKPGDEIQVTWIDTGGTHTATVRLIAGPTV